MENVENAYCRFCAEPKHSEKLLNLDSDESTCNEVLLKLAFLNAVYVNVSNCDNLPKTVCFICYESLNKAFEFLDSVKRAQEVLSSLFSTNDATKFSDDAFDDLDFLSQDATEDVPEVKQEISSPKKLEPSVPDLEHSVDVKIEPKDESGDGNISQERLAIANSSDTYNQTLNVEDILDEALSNRPFTSNVMIYAKVVTDIKNVAISWKSYPWICSYCNIEFLDVDMLRQHAKSSHRRCAAFTCIDCKAFGKKDNFNSFVKHVKKHRKNFRDHCYYCDAHLAGQKLKSHIKQHFLKSQVPCPACGEVLKNEESLRQHLCEFNSVKPKRKPRRKAGTPITIEDLTCPMCKKVYKNPNSLRDHVKRHTIDRKRNYTCDRCGKTFYNKGTLTSHIMSHDKIRPHVCRICNKSFLFPNMLRRHVEMHSGIKPFSCEQCGRCFRLQYQLNAHKIVHTDSMPYVCQYCNKAFRFKQILKNHERQHTGAKPYCCQHCSMEFSNWSNYNKHMVRRHGTDTSKKKITPEGVFPINPETGQIIQMQDQSTEEWKTKIMIPAKRGKKKAIKLEHLGA